MTLSLSDLHKHSKINLACGLLKCVQLHLDQLPATSRFPNDAPQLFALLTDFSIASTHRLFFIDNMANKSKGKGRDSRQSRSRNTTPSSGLSASTATAASTAAGYLDNEFAKLFAGITVQYSDLLEQSGGGGNIPDIKTLELISENLKTLSQLADTRGDTCNAGMRELSQRKKDVIEDQHQQEMERDAEDRVKMKREADDDAETSRAFKGHKLKKRKERPPKEDRPLAVGAHEVSRQDGGELGMLFTLISGYRQLIKYRRSQAQSRSCLAIF